MFDPAVEAVLKHQEKATGNASMRRVTRRAAELGYSVLPNPKGGYLRLALKPPGGTPVTLYLHSNRLAASATGLQDFAAALPGAVVTAHDVRFPVVRVEIDALESFAHHARGPTRPGSSPAAAPDRPDAGHPVPAPRAPLRSIPAGRPIVTPPRAGALVPPAIAIAPDRSPARRHGRLRTGILVGLVTALALFMLGYLLGGTSPDPTSPPASVSAEAQIAAAEQQLAEAEAAEPARPVDALVDDPSAGILGDTAASDVISTAGQTTALAALATLEVKGRAPKTGYDRDLFGGGWGDIDRNGCDTRNDILARDLGEETFTPGTRNCVVLTGALSDPYSGRTIAFQRGRTTSDDVQIDHVVAVSDAWQKGAQGWSGARRIAFYNDPLNLLAVDGGLNVQKGDGDAATWLPPNRGYRCAYAARQIAVKVTYELWVTQAERNAMATVLSACPAELLPMGVVAVPAESMPVPTTPPAPAQDEPPVVVPVPDQPPVVVPVPDPPVVVPAPLPAPVPLPPPPSAASYANCDAVRAAGAAPIYPGDPGWEQKFDRDHDGVGCEP